MDNEIAAASPVPVPELSPAGFWVRGGALLVDSIILALSVFLPVRGLGLLVGLAYKTIFISQGGQTPGKMAAGIKVVAVGDGPVGTGRALARALAEYLSGVLFFIGYPMAAFGPKRALHDYVAGTRVVYVEGVSAGRKALFAGLGICAVAVTLGSIATGIYFVGGYGKFKTLTVKAGEGSAKGHLGSLRSALSIYYGDMEGQYPAALDALIPNHLQTMPKLKLAGHEETAAWTPYGAEVCTGSSAYGTEIDAAKLQDTGGWGYVADPNAKCHGMVFVDCAHQDTKGKRWPEY